MHRFDFVKSGTKYTCANCWAQQPRQKQTRSPSAAPASRVWWRKHAGCIFALQRRPEQYPSSTSSTVISGHSHAHAQSVTLAAFAFATGMTSSARMSSSSEATPSNRRRASGVGAPGVGAPTCVRASRAGRMRRCARRRSQPCATLPASWRCWSNRTKHRAAAGWGYRPRSRRTPPARW